jgi:hypothetical protein
MAEFADDPERILPSSVLRTIARAWGLDVEQLGTAIPYLRARLLEGEGQLELVEVQHRPDTDKYIFSPTDPALPAGRVGVDRPLGWSVAYEARALEDMREAIESGEDGDDGDDEEAA